MAQMNVLLLSQEIGHYHDNKLIITTIKWVKGVVL